MRKAKLLFILFWIMLSAQGALYAQVQLGGLADFEIRKGGEDSSPYVNQTPNDNWSLYTPYLRLFINGNISEDWYISAALQSDYYDGKSLSTPFFSVVNINWLPINNSNFTITAGRFVTPYGTYSDRVLSSDNPFVHLPLSHASGLPISKRYGTLYDNVDYSGDVKGLTMVYQRMYAQGIKFSNNLGDTEWLQYDIAATLAPASSHFEYGEYQHPAIIGRVVVKPVVWAGLGFSFSHGSFMKRDEAVNADISSGELSGYTQTVLGADLKLSYHYYVFVASYNYSKWEAPYLNTWEEGTPSYLWDDETEVQHFSLEFISDLPFLVGSYVGLRYEQLLPGQLTTYQQDGYEENEPWSYDRQRVELTAGYRIQRNLKVKASYLYSDDSGPGLDDDVFALQLSVGF